MTPAISLRQVWICDQHDDTSRVLRALYEPKGAQVRQIQVLRQIEQPSPSEQPDLIILNISSKDPIASAVESKYQSVPRIVIGSVKTEPGFYAKPDPCSENESSPLKGLFQFKDLISRVDSILDSLDEQAV